MRDKKPRALPRRVPRTPIAAAILLACPALLAQDRPAAASRRSSSPRRSGRKTCRTCRSASRRSAPKSSTEMNVRNFRDYVQLLPAVTIASGTRRRRRVLAGLHARHRHRRRRPGDHLAAQRRHVPRRTADHHGPGQPGHPHVRHRARRGAGRPAGHAVRRQLAGGHDPHHHQQAGSVGVLGGLRGRGQHRRRGRHRLRGRGLRQRAARPTRPRSASSAGRARTPAGSTTSSARAPSPADIDNPDDDITIDNAGARRGQLQHGRHHRRPRRTARRAQRRLGDHAGAAGAEAGERRLLGRRPQRLCPGRQRGHALHSRSTPTTSGTRSA